MCGLPRSSLQYALFIFVNYLQEDIIRVSTKMHLSYTFIAHDWIKWKQILHNQCLSPLTLWVWIPHRRGVLDTTLWDKVCQWLVAGVWFFTGTLVSSTNKIDGHDITEILLKVALKTITLTLPLILQECFFGGSQ